MDLPRLAAQLWPWIARLFMAQGTYTPTYIGLTSAGTTTYAANGQIGYYLRLGPLCYVQGHIVWTAATGTGTAAISLPITAAAGTNRDGTIVIYTYNVTIGSFTPQAAINPATAYFTMWQPQNNAASGNITVEAAGEVIFSGWYFVE